MAQATLAEKVADAIGYYDAALKKASVAMTAKEAAEAAAAKLIPAALDALLANDRIGLNEREKVAAQLKDPAKVLELLAKTAAHRNAAEQGLGQPVGTTTTKTAAASLTSPWVGRRSSDVKQSDVNLWTKLGLQAPTS